MYFNYSLVLTFSCIIIITMSINILTPVVFHYIHDNFNYSSPRYTS